MSIPAGSIQKESRANGGRYFHVFADGSEAEMIYVADGRDIAIITHTYTPPAHRGQGTAAALVAKAVADFRAEGRRVIPSCWFAREEFRAHPEWADLLVEGRGGPGA
jgi:predicted GNAT family acetyltransferase